MDAIEEEQPVTDQTRSEAFLKEAKKIADEDKRKKEVKEKQAKQAVTLGNFANAVAKAKATANASTDHPNSQPGQGNGKSPQGAGGHNQQEAQLHNTSSKSKTTNGWWPLFQPRRGGDGTGLH